MWKLRRGYNMLNLCYVLGYDAHVNVSSLQLGNTHVGKLLVGPKFSHLNENIKYPFSVWHKNPVFYSTSSVHLGVDAKFVEYNGDNDENVSDNGENEDVGEEKLGVVCEESVQFDHECDDSDNDESACENVENGDKDKNFGVLCEKSEDFEQDVEALLSVLKGMRSKKGINGGELSKKLSECGVALTSQLVSEVISRSRNDWEVAFTFFVWVGKQPGYVCSVREYHSMISILCKCRKTDTAWLLVEEMRQRGIVKPETLLIIIRRYCGARDVVSALSTFHAFKRFNFDVGVEVFQQLLSALVRYKNVKEAEGLLLSNKSTFPFNTKSFNIILNGWCNVLKRLSEAKRIQQLMMDQGVELDAISYSTIISGYAKMNRLKEVVRLYEKIKEMEIKLDRKVYNAVIHALAKGGCIQEALTILETMKTEGCSPNPATYNSLIGPLCRAQKMSEALKLMNEMLSCGLRPTVITWHALLHIQKTEEGIFTLLDKMKDLGCHPNKDTYLLLIKKLCRMRKHDTVSILWDEMTEKGWGDSTSYTTLIRGLYWSGKMEDAYNLYSEMKAKSLILDASIDELIQTWLSNKQMAESKAKTLGHAVNGEYDWGTGRLLTSNMVKTGMAGSLYDSRRDSPEQPEFRKVIRQRGFSFWE